jgi:hypothetical protein
MNPEISSAAKNLRNQIEGFTEESPMVKAIQERLDESFFSPAKPAAERILNIFRILRETDLEQLPAEVLRNMTHVVHSAVAELANIKDYSNNPSRGRQDFDATMTKAWEALYKESIPHILSANFFSNALESDS